MARVVVVLELLELAAWLSDGNALVIEVVLVREEGRRRRLKRPARPAKFFNLPGKF